MKNPVPQISSEKIEQEVATFLQRLEERIEDLPEHLGLRFDQIMEVLHIRHTTGSISGFATKLFANPAGLTHPVRPHGKRGVALGDDAREEIRKGLMKREPGLVIARRMRVSPSTVSLIRRTLQEEGKL